MNILKFYDQLEVVPPNLARHQLEVGAVAQLVVDHWQGESIDQGLVIQTALVHDVGNLVKYTFPLEHQMYGEIVNNEQFWHQKQKQLIKEYGRDADLVTESLLKEHGLNREANLLKEIRLGKYEGQVLSLSPEAQIVFLADGAVAPVGVVGIRARVADVKRRYAGNEKMLLWVEALMKNKEILQPKANLDLDRLDQLDFSKRIKRLRSYDLLLAKS